MFACGVAPGLHSVSDHGLAAGERDRCTRDVARLVAGQHDIGRFKFSPIVRSMALRRENAVSIGSGLQGGRKRRVAPAASSFSRTAARLWLDRLPSHSGHPAAPANKAAVTLLRMSKLEAVLRSRAGPAPWDAAQGAGTPVKLQFAPIA